MAVETSGWIGRSLAADRYQVTAKLGEGGMGYVFRAWDRSLECDVVIKVPRRDMLEDPAFAGRFEREIRSLVRLAHPHIVKVLDFGAAEGLPYAVLQYLSGGGLSNHVDPARLSLPERLQKLHGWLAQVAAALDFMHSQGYIHRDVKPENILFDAHGNVFLSDFGIAKVVADSRPTAQQTVRTQTGLVLGTPQYMAPELIMGQPHDGRVDEYALAVVVYQMLSGTLPINGPTPAAILVEQTLRQPVPLHELRPQIPRPVAMAVQRALAKDPGQRYPDCMSFARETLAAAGALAGRHVRAPGTQEAGRPSPHTARRDTRPAEPTAETYQVAQTYAEWQTSPPERAGSSRKKVQAVPVARPATGGKGVPDSREPRSPARPDRVQKRKRIGYLILACAIGVPMVAVAATLVAIFLMNLSPQETATVPPVQRSPPVLADKSVAPEPRGIPDSRPQSEPDDKKTRTGKGAVQESEFRVQVSRVWAEGRRLLIRLQVENSGLKSVLRLSLWERNAAGSVPRLTDQRGTSFPWIDSAGQNSSSLVIEPGKSVPLLLLFDLPPGDVGPLRLELPTEAFGRAGRLQLDITDEMLQFVTARSRKGKAVPGLREALAHADPEIRAAAARALGEIGPDAAAAVPELADRLTDDTKAVRAAAAQALGEIGMAAREARPGLLRALGDADAQVSSAAAKALKSLPAPTRADLTDLRQALKGPNPKARAYAMDALARMGAEVPTALDELLTALKDADPALRASAAGVLGTMGNADEVVNALAQASKDQEVEVRRSAIRSLAAFKPVPPIVRALIAALDDRDGEVARLAGERLKTVRFGKEEVTALAEVLGRAHPDGRASAASLLAAVGPEVNVAKANLITALEDKDKRVRQQAAKALGNMKGDAWDASRKLAALLSDDEVDVRRSAIAALGQIGPDAAAAVPQLIRALRNPGLHDDASTALVKVGKKAVPGLLEMLAAKSSSEKIEACRILGEMKGEAVDAVEPLSALARDKKNQLPKVLKAADEALEKIR